MSDQPTFNLIYAPWLPVRRRSGAVERIAPWQVTDGFDVDPIVAFDWPRADFNGAAHELLIGLLSTVAAPEGPIEWESWWFDPPSPADLKQRFSSVAHAFDLDGPGPRFLQDVDPLEDGATKEVAALLIDSPGAQTLRNNADLFIKRRSEPVFSRAAAAIALFTLSSYAPSGGAGHRTSLRGGGPMTTLVVADHPKYGTTLWGRLWPNVSDREDGVAVGSVGDLNAGVFPWLATTRTSDPKARGRHTTPNDVHPLHVHWAMPRRIRLVFEEARGRRCILTNSEDAVVAVGYRTRNYGANYSEGFEHPLTPYYRQKATSPTKLPVHPDDRGITYRLWTGLVVASADGLRQPARVVRQWDQRAPEGENRKSRFVAFGYDMDNMKACAWVEGEMPLLQWDASVRDRLESFVRQATAGANTVARLLTTAVKSARYDRPKDAPGDYGFVGARFFRESETQFYAALDGARELVALEPDADDPARDAKTRWAKALARAAEALFDEFAPSEGLEDRNMQRHVKARFQLGLALHGRGKVGKALFEGDLGIAAPKSAQSSSRDEAP